MKIIVGRQKQIQQLHEALTSNKPEMVAIIGRRRVGKTFLIRNVYEKNLSFELTGVQYATQKEQLQIFSARLRLQRERAENAFQMHLYIPLPHLLYGIVNGAGRQRHVRQRRVLGC